MTDVMVILIGLTITAVAVAFGGLVLEGVLKIMSRTMTTPTPDPPKILPVANGRQPDSMQRAA